MKNWIRGAAALTIAGLLTASALATSTGARSPFASKQFVNRKVEGAKAELLQSLATAKADLNQALGVVQADLANRPTYDLIKRVTNIFDAPANSDSGGVASCPDDYAIVGGGVMQYPYGDTASLYVLASGSGPEHNGWFVRMRNPLNEMRQFSVTALCLENAYLLSNSP